MISTFFCLKGRRTCWTVFLFSNFSPATFELFLITSHHSTTSLTSQFTNFKITFTLVFFLIPLILLRHQIHYCPFCWRLGLVVWIQSICNIHLKRFSNDHCIIFILFYLCSVCTCAQGPWRSDSCCRQQTFSMYVLISIAS